MKKFLEAVAFIQRSCEALSVLLFIFYWPIASMYWVVCGMLGVAGKAVSGVSTILSGVLVVIAVLMAFLLPIWALIVIGIYFISSVLAIASFRPMAIILLLVAFLERKNYIPNGHVGIDDAKNIMELWFDRWYYPLIYSTLSILVGIFVFLSWRRSENIYAR